MKTISLLQLGDIHFPDHKAESAGDIKDTGLSASLVDSVIPKRLRSVMLKVGQVIKEDPISCLLICGDLTSRGNLNEYNACVDYLESVLSIGSATTLAQDAIHVVPGNHDVNRDLSDPSDLYVKFEPLVRSWDRYARGILAANDIRATNVVSNGCTLSLYSLNSCIGCGESRYLPTKIRDEIYNAMQTYVGSAPPDDACDLVYEQLDTPALVDAHVEKLIAEINTAAPASLPIVLAHHNVLPQAVTRLELYTELINSGRLRDQLASCKRPLIYCHGHIHNDPIERVCDYSYKGSSVVCVSAPEAVEGFNVLKIYFGRRTNLPLGCEVIRYRPLYNFGTVDRRDSVRIPFATPELITQSKHDNIDALLHSCNSDHIRFNDLREKVNATLGKALQVQTLSDVILEAEWLGLVSVIDRQLDSKFWQVRRVEP